MRLVHLEVVLELGQDKVVKCEQGRLSLLTCLARGPVPVPMLLAPHCLRKVQLGHGLLDSHSLTYLNLHLRESCEAERSNHTYLTLITNWIWLLVTWSTVFLQISISRWLQTLGRTRAGSTGLEGTTIRSSVSVGFFGLKQSWSELAEDGWNFPSK